MGDRDRTDEHVARWTPILPDLDPDTEGAVTRMGRFAKHIKRVREDLLVASGLQRHEYDTLHALAGRHGTAAPSELAADLGMPPNSVTGGWTRWSAAASSDGRRPPPTAAGSSSSSPPRAAPPGVRPWTGWATRRPASSPP
ncbi:hypothetical protein [Actinomadura madurae]|uniref:hypothetical protein n=1 Tax=Actinomadura madurae TaxID=1993 RepID=UPI0020D258AE|nr:hypothetical protein [Actinomadura madurae]MCP9981584.1 hypothetical protein [Actinomadura madurae]